MAVKSHRVHPAGRCHLPPHYGVEMRSVLTGFKWIGDQIANLEAAGEVDRFIFGFEESYGYLAGPMSAIRTPSSAPC